MEILQQLKRYATWLYEPKLFFLFVLYIVLAFLGLNLFNYKEPSFRLIGLFLQFLGICTVIIGFYETRKNFNQLPYSKLFINWLKRFPNKENIAFIEIDSVKVGISGLNATLTTVFRLDPESSIADQLIKIQDKIVSLDTQFDTLNNNNLDEISSLKSKLAEEIVERGKLINDALKVIEDTSTQGIHISFIGTIWLLIGVIFSTASLELSGFFVNH